MAYSATGLPPIGGQSKAGNAPQMWAYTSTDAATVIRVTGYFNSAAGLLKVGDLMWIHHTTGGTRGYLLSPVVSNTGTVVDIADGLAIAADDSD